MTIWQFYNYVEKHTETTREEVSVMTVLELKDFCKKNFEKQLLIKMI